MEAGCSLWVWNWLAGNDFLSRQKLVSLFLQILLIQLWLKLKNSSTLFIDMHKITGIMHKKSYFNFSCFLWWSYSAAGWLAKCYVCRFVTEWLHKCVQERFSVWRNLYKRFTNQKSHSNLEEYNRMQRREEKTLNLPFLYCLCRHANCDTENGIIAESWRHQRRSRRVFRVLDSIESEAIQDVLVPQCESQISTGMFARCRSETVCETAMENLTFFYLSCLAVGCREDFAILNALNATKPKKSDKKNFPFFFHLKKRKFNKL